jgi:hypothetical protein
MTTTTLEFVDASEAVVDAAPARTGRRFAILGATSALIAGLATLLDPKTASAADCQGSPCCHLARCNLCYYQVSHDRYTCPSGYYRVMWTCVSGGVTWGCGECSTNSSSCWSGTFACSIYFRW